MTPFLREQTTARAAVRRGGAVLVARSWAVIRALVAASLTLTAANDPLAAARAQFEAGQYEQAVATLRAVLAQSPQSAPVHYWLARSYFELEDFDHAVASAQKAVEIDRGNSEYHLWLGRSYGRKAEHSSWFSALSLAKKTRREFEEAVRLNPSNFVAQHDLIEFCLRAPGIVGGGEEKARQQAQSLAALDTGESHLGLGAYWMHKKDPPKAEAEYRQVLAAKPKRIEPYLEVAEFHQNRREGARMEEAVEAAGRLDASDRRLSYYRGVAYILTGKRPAEAEQLLRAYLEKVPKRSDFPSPASAREWLGSLYEQQGKRQAAAEQYRAAVVMEPRNKGAREGLRRVQQ